MIVTPRGVIRCMTCDGRFTMDGTLAKDPSGAVRGVSFGDPNAVHICKGGKFLTMVICFDSALRSCRESEPRRRRSASGSGFAKPGECGLHCRGSVSPGCACPVCKGANHGELRLAKPADPGALDTLYGGIEAAKPRGDWPGRKST